MIAERIGWERGLAILWERELRPAYLHSRREVGAESRMGSVGARRGCPGRRSPQLSQARPDFFAVTLLIHCQIPTLCTVRSPGFQIGGDTGEFKSEPPRFR